MTEEISRKTICEAFEKLAITRGDNIVMHSNLRSLGRARDIVKLPNCGADAIIDGMLDAIGPEGILCVPVFTSTFMRGGPSGEIFDPDTTKSRVGSITNKVLERPERVRSLHPTHSWAALGNDAGSFTEGHERTSTFGRDSVCGRMYDMDFKIVWFGTDGRTNTSTHFAEDWLNLPNMTSEDALVKKGDGFEKVTVFRSPSGPRDFYSRDSKVDKKLAEWNIAAEGKVHNARVTVMRHREFMNNLLSAMIEDPALLLTDSMDSRYNKYFHPLNSEYMDQLKNEKGGAEGILRDLGCTLG